MIIPGPDLGTTFGWVKLPAFCEIGRSCEQVAQTVRLLSQQIQRLTGDCDTLAAELRRPGQQMQRLRDDRDTANAQLHRLHALPLGRRRKAERLAAYCPRSCQVVAVYATSGRLLLWLRGDVLITGETLLVDVPDGRPHPRGTHLAHRGHWVTDRTADRRRWMVDCHHATYPVTGASLLALLPAMGRVTVDVSALAPAAC